jgi:aminoacylase
VSLKGGIAEGGASASFNDAKFIMNLQPATAEAGFDMRLPPMSSAEMNAVERMIREEWAPAALNFSVTFTIQARVRSQPASVQCPPHRSLRFSQAKRLQPDGSASVTSMDAAVNPWWGAFTASMAAQGLEIQPDIFPAATDASYLRVKGIPSLGFSPMRCVAARRRCGRCSLQHRSCRRTPKLLHEHDEHLSVETYREGISIYERLIADLANFPDDFPGKPGGARDEL